MAWHKNLGELLNYHSTAHIQRRDPKDAGGNPSYRMNLTLSHWDIVRLNRVREVVGGAIDEMTEKVRVGNRHMYRLKLWDSAAFSVIKCGRHYCDPQNNMVFDILDTLMSFYRTVPGRGQKASEKTLVSQESLKERLNRLSALQRRRGMPRHDCDQAREWAGGVLWGRPNPYDAWGG